MKTAHDITTRLRTADVLNEENSNVDFASLLLSRPVLDGLHHAGFQRPSPIQLKAIPLGRCGLDLIIQAKSGTGKTCVFSVIALESIDLSNNATQVLILAPTREIAVQIQQVILDIGQKMSQLRCHVFIGGTLIGPDKQNLKKCHIAVGTPGRVKQLIETGVLAPDSIRLCILDEADKLLDDKFQSQINWIYNELPYSKQILAASATYPEFLAQHLTSYMRDATFVRLNPKEVALHGIRQFFKLVEGHELPHKAFALKVNHLVDLLSNVTFQQCLVFSNLHTRAENLCDILCYRGWPSMFISGGLEQRQRLHAMSTFKKFECRVLISTDLTARGIDAEKVNLVINLDVPVDVKTYLHRIGRAGRFGTYGASVTFASYGREELLLHSIQKESHVPIIPLPDPVPSDLLSPYSEVTVPTTKLDSHNCASKEGFDNSNDTQLHDLTTDQSRLPKLDVEDECLKLLSSNQSVFPEEVSRSADHSITKPRMNNVAMLDKMCQTVNPNSVLNDIVSYIPPLKETLALRNLPKWSFEDAVKDFKRFMKTGELEADRKTFNNLDIKDHNQDLNRISNDIVQETKHSAQIQDEDCNDTDENQLKDIYSNSQNPDVGDFCQDVEKNLNDKSTTVVQKKLHSEPWDKENNECKFQLTNLKETSEHYMFKNNMVEGSNDSESKQQSGAMKEKVCSNVSLIPEGTTDGKISCDTEETIKINLASNFDHQDEYNEAGYTNFIEDCSQNRKMYADVSKDFGETSNSIELTTFNKEGRKVLPSRKDHKVYAEKISVLEGGEIEKERSHHEEDEYLDEARTSSVNEDMAVNDGNAQDSSGIFFIKDGVVVQISSKKNESAIFKELKESSSDGTITNDSPDMSEVTETKIVDCKKEIVRKQRHKKKHTEKAGGDVHNTSLYNNHTQHSSYYGNGKVPNTYSYYDTGYSSYYNNDKALNNWSSYNYDYPGYPSNYYNGKSTNTRSSRSSDYSNYHSYYRNGTSTHYGYSGYPSYYYNGSLPHSHNQMSHMGYDSRLSYSGASEWPYYWSYPYYWSSSYAGTTHQQHGWYPSGHMFPYNSSSYKS